MKNGSGISSFYEEIIFLTTKAMGRAKILKHWIYAK